MNLVEMVTRERDKGTELLRDIPGMSQDEARQAAEEYNRGFESVKQAMDYHDNMNKWIWFRSNLEYFSDN